MLWQRPGGFASNNVRLLSLDVNELNLKRSFSRIAKIKWYVQKKLIVVPQPSQSILRSRTRSL